MRYLLLLLVLWGCDSRTDRAMPSDAGADPSREDSDHDGLCDTTEVAAGTDPNAPDSDGDGLPDGLEQVLGFSALDDSSPTAEQQIQASTTTTVVVRFTVDGMGETFQGVFLPVSSPFASQDDASSLLSGARGVEALPPDNVRNMLADAQRFETVTGTTRLSFELTFNLSTLTPEACTLAYPFAYGVSQVGGGLLEQRNYLLIVPGETPNGAAPDYCLAANCI